jgi:23S rRNA (cytidine1920-2'-O)/16S rRNA (cytidine1409-2'-O)-methyltransferase
LAKSRIDVLLARNNLAESREKAKIFVMAGIVYVNGERVSRPDKMVDEGSVVEVRKNPLAYVGYGGIKLKEAVRKFGIEIRGKKAIDVGSSTGGFVDYLVQSGAEKVYAVDVGTHQLHEKLREDKRVVLLENVNARYLTESDIGEKADIITVDVSFISLKKVLPAVIPLLAQGGVLITLVKPQFEVGRYQVGKGGIVKDDEKINRVLEDIKESGRELGIRAVDTVEAPREKERKNKEYFILWER